MKFICTIALIAVLQMPTLTLQAATRLALVSSGNDDRLANIVELTTAQLSADENLELLDRVEISRVLREQEASLSGLFRAEEAVAAGQLLGADLFAVIEGSSSGETGSPLGLVVFDAKTGVRYKDVAIQALNEIVAVDAIVSTLQSGFQKFDRGSDELFTIGLLSVRNADLPRQWDSLYESVGLLLERELAASESIAVLERRRLEQVNQERGLVPGEDGVNLLSSLRLIELDVGRDGDGLRGMMTITSPDGSRQSGMTASVDTMNPAALAEALAQRVLGSLQISSPRVVRNRIAEASRFHREFQLLAQHLDFDEAVRALDAAIALAPDNEEYAGDLIPTLRDAAIESIDPGGSKLALGWQPDTQQILVGLMYAQRQADMIVDIMRTTLDRIGPNDPIPEIMEGRIKVSSLDDFLENIARVRDVDVLAQVELNSLAQNDRMMRLEMMEPVYRERVTSADGFADYSEQIRRLVFPQHAALYEPEQVQSDAITVARRWLEFSRQFNPPDGSGDYRGIRDPLRWGYVLNNPVFEPVWKQLLQDADPVVRYYARLALIKLQENTGARGSPELFSSVRAFRLDAQEWLARSGDEMSEPLRDIVWDGIEDALSIIAGDYQFRDEAWRECLDACRFAFETEAVRPTLFTIAVDAFGVRETQPGAPLPSIEHPEEALEVLNGALALLNQHLDANSDLLDGPLAPSTTLDRQRSRQLLARSALSRRDRFESLRSSVFPGESSGGATETSLWSRVTKLYEVSGESFTMILQPVVSNGSLYFCAYDDQLRVPYLSDLQLVRVPLEGGDAQLLGKVEVESLLEPREVDGSLPFLPRSACIGMGHYFIGTQSGVYAFPLDGGSVLRLYSGNGLPADHVHALAFLDGTLYIGLGEVEREGFLVAYDWTTRTAEVLASSRRSERLSPFDDRTPFYPLGLIADVPRNRLLMVAGEVSNSPNAYTSTQSSTGSPVSGIWAFSPEKRTFTRVANIEVPVLMILVRIHGQTGYWAGQLDSNTLGVVAHQSNVAILDLRNDELIVKASYWQTILRDPGDWEARPPVDAVPVHGPFFIYDKQIWSTSKHWQNDPNGIQRLSLDGTQGTRVLTRVTVPGLQQITFLQLLPDGSRVVMADRDAVWLLEFQEKPFEKK